MSDGTERTILYNAQGYAITGSITRPYTETIEVQASSTVSTLGGNALVEKEDYYSPQKSLYYSYASTQVAGSSASDGGLDSLVTTTIEGLNVLDTVTADRMVLKISLHLPADGGQPSIIPLGTLIDNLVIAGHKINIDFDHETFVEHDTYEKFQKRFAADKDFRKRIRKQFLWGDYDENTPDYITKRFQWHTNPEALPESQGLLPCNLVKSIESPNSKALQINGNVIKVPQFGKVYIGDGFMQSKSRRFRLLYMELGCPVVGVVGGPDGATEGSYFP